MYQKLDPLESRSIKLNENIITFIQQNTLQNFVYKMTSILLSPQFDSKVRQNGDIIYDIVSTTSHWNLIAAMNYHFKFVALTWLFSCSYITPNDVVKSSGYKQ